VVVDRRDRPRPRGGGGVTGDMVGVAIPVTVPAAPRSDERRLCGRLPALDPARGPANRC
jgi:hypothetical protein